MSSNSESSCGQKNGANNTQCRPWLRRSCSVGKRGSRPTLQRRRYLSLGSQSPGNDHLCIRQHNASMFNPLMDTLKAQSNGPLYSTTVMVHWPLMGRLLHLVQRGKAWVDCSPLLAVPHVIAHPSTASVPTSYYSMWHYNYQCPLKA